MDITSGLGYPRKTWGKPQNCIRRLAGLIHRFPPSHLANTTGTTCRNLREKRDSRWDRRSADILAISSSEQRFRYIPLQRIPGIPGVNEAVARPICYVTTPAWASRLASDSQHRPAGDCRVRGRGRCHSRGVAAHNSQEGVARKTCSLLSKAGLQSGSSTH